jgi:nickel/cobalt transporter (NicO) family protein
MTLALALVGAAISIGAVHTCAPDHWMPFAALSRANRWSARRTASITAMCGLGHVTVSVLLGVLALAFGREIFEAFGKRLESVAGLLLIGFGVAYAAWGIRNAIADHVHRNAHAHGHHHHHLKFTSHASMATSHEPSAINKLTPFGLFLLFSADPCVAVIPLMFASAPLGWTTTLAVVAAYEIATIATMVLLVLPAHAAVAAVRPLWTDRYGDAVAGGVVAAVGVVVMALGI